jgi:hypothetical protein
MGIFEKRLLLGYSRLEYVMGSEATYTSPSRAVTHSMTIIANELVGALDGLAQTTMHLRTGSVTYERGGQITTEDGVIWDVIDVRDSNDGTAEVRCATPIIIGS